MRFLVDNALSPTMSAGLSVAGHDALHVRDVDLATAADDRIFDFAAQEHRIIVSMDTDFGTLLANREQSQPSVVLFRRVTGRKPAELLALLLVNLAALESELIAGSIVVIEQSRIRIRRLPIRKEPV